MIKESKSEPDCSFCCFDNIKKEGRIIKDKKDWYAFIPLEPEIFGHVIVTYRTDTELNYPCIQNIICLEDEKRDKILNVLNEGILTLVDGLKKIKNVDKVYFAMLGETENTHMHYHLFPRYGFVNDYELDKWANKKDYTRLSNGSIEWRKFFARPTCGFKSFTGFQYLGEIEASQERTLKCIGKKPSKKLIEEMVNNIKKICKF